MLVMLVNVLLPEIVNAPAPPWLSVGYTTPPPPNVFAEALVIEIVAAPVSVAVEPDEKLHAKPEPVTVHVPEPRLIGIPGGAQPTVATVTL